MTLFVFDELALKVSPLTFSSCVSPPAGMAALELVFVISTDERAPFGSAYAMTRTKSWPEIPFTVVEEPGASVSTVLWSSVRSGAWDREGYHSSRPTIASDTVS